EKLKLVYRRLCDAMTIHPDVVEAADKVARKILANKDRYVAIEQQTQVPWFFTGLVHNRESGLNFNTYLGNGQRLDRRTTIVPTGRGPFATFEEGAVDAYKVQDMIGLTDWSLERIAYLLEGYNGVGYYYKGVNSPYLWAGTNQYTSGKYVADHDFRPDVVDHQLGSMVVLARLAAMDPDVKNRLGGGPEAGIAPVAVDSLGRGATGDRVRALQTALAQQGFNQVGKIDGDFGPNTAVAVRAFQTAHGLPVTGVADRATQDAILGAKAPAPAGDTGLKSEDVLRHLFGALPAQGLPQAPGPAPGPVPGAKPGAGDDPLALIIAALLGRQPAIAPTTAGGLPPPPILSPIDKVLGGEALAGKKTALSIVAYVIMAILKAAGVVGAATPGGQIVTILIAAFGSLRGIAKVDRAIRMLGMIAAKGPPPTLPGRPPTLG